MLQFYYTYCAERKTMNRLLFLTFLLLTGSFTSMFSQSSYNVYYGDIHSHTWYSDGNQDQDTNTYKKPVARSLTLARDSASNLDFLGISDHNHGEGGLNMKLGYWRSGFQEADSINQDGSFVGLYGQEWGVISGGGHVMVYGTDKLFGWESGLYDVFVTKSNYGMLFDSVKKYNGFCYLAHPQPSDFGGIFTGAYNASWDSVVTGVAVKSGPAFSVSTTESDPISGNYLTQYHDLLRLGYHVAPCGNQDNHNTTHGRANQQRTAVLATSLTKQNVLDALRYRHAYASEDHNLKIDYTVGSHIMGDIFTTSGAVNVRVKITDGDGESINTIELRYGIPGSGTAPTALTSVSNRDSLIYTNNQPLNTTYYYYIYVKEADNQQAWSAPIWVTTTNVTSPPPDCYACYPFQQCNQSIAFDAVTMEYRKQCRHIQGSGFYRFNICWDKSS